MYPYNSNLTKGATRAQRGDLRSSQTLGTGSRSSLFSSVREGPQMVVTTVAIVCVGLQSRWTSQLVICRVWRGMSLYMTCLVFF